MITDTEMQPGSERFTDRDFINHARGFAARPSMIRGRSTSPPSVESTAATCERSGAAKVE